MVVGKRVVTHLSIILVKLNLSETNNYACANENMKQKYLKPNLMSLRASFAVCRQL